MASSDPACPDDLERMVVLQDATYDPVLSSVGRPFADASESERGRPATKRDFGPQDGETRTRTGDTTIFSRGSTAGECVPFPATTRGAVAGLRVRTCPRFPHDCGVL